MKNTVSDNAMPKRRIKASARSADALAFIEVGGGGGPAPDAKKHLAAFYTKYPLRTLKRGERGIVESLKADRNRR